jgi:tRNA isopentenyl-2-thiomethyl-A-37 hydroxylase MiaE
MNVVLLLAITVFLAVCALTFLPSLRLLYARNPSFSGMVLTLVSSFLGVYMALHFSRSEELADRTARAATLMEMTRESLSASQVESRLIAELRKIEAIQADEGIGSDEAAATLASYEPKRLADLLSNGAVIEQISPESLKALLASQSFMEKELRSLNASKGRQRRRHLRQYLREMAFAQGVLAAEAEFQRGNIGRKDLVDILRAWSEKKNPPQI